MDSSPRELVSYTPSGYMSICTRTGGPPYPVGFFRQTTKKANQSDMVVEHRVEVVNAAVVNNLVSSQDCGMFCLNGEIMLFTMFVHCGALWFC